MEKVRVAPGPAVRVGCSLYPSLNPLSLAANSHNTRMGQIANGVERTLWLGQDAQVAYTRDKMFWYPHGNIIVVAQGVAFRVFKGIIAEEEGYHRGRIRGILRHVLASYARSGPSAISSARSDTGLSRCPCHGHSC